MIGLGSNRLSVCRRGGMSVTQAGRGGMEWLAGGRMPSWANPYLPYSKAAGEALVAQFPTQWPTIRDYGFAHPALVPFINEDPMLWGHRIAYHKTNLDTFFANYMWCDYIRNTANSWLNTETQFASGDRITVRAKLVLEGFNSSYSACFYGGFSNTTQIVSVIFGQNGNLSFEAPGNPRQSVVLASGTIETDTLYDLRVNEEDGSYINGEKVTSTVLTNTSASYSENCLFTRASKVENFKGKAYQLWILKNGEDYRDFMPCYRKSDNVIGGYDLVSGIFKTNSGGGTFGKGSDIPIS